MTATALKPMKTQVSSVMQTLLLNLTMTDTKDAISSLLLTLAGHRIAKRLRSKESNGTIVGELARLVTRFDSAQIEVSAFRPLATVVVQQSTDVEIWKQVLLLITASSRLTPPPSVSASFGGTPRTHNSSSHQGSEQTRRLLQDPLRDEFHDCSYVKVAGFFEKYFDGKSWAEKSKDIFEAVKGTHKDGRWTTFPSKPTEDDVWKWWSCFQTEHLADSPSAYHRTKDKTEMVNADGERQVDLFVKSRRVISSEKHRWEDVRAIGEHTESTDRGKKFLQLARYARNVFIAQPRRQFLHAFILSYTEIEPHIFDRSGSYSMESFDIHEEPERFIRIISGYCLMSDEEHGLDTFIEREGSAEFVTVADSDGKDVRLALDPKPIARQAAVVGRGTSCYLTVDGNSVAKLSWVSAGKSPAEADLLKRAHEKQVKGAPSLIGHRRGVNTSKLRAPLIFTKKRRIEGRQYNMHRQGSNVSFSSQFASLPISDGERKRKSIDAGESFSKKSRSNSQVSRLSQVHEAEASFNESQASQATGEPFVDRVLYIQATQPAGRPLARFTSVGELLRAMRDAIKVHRSLFLDGSILHRDVSESNIIITDPDKNDGLAGSLIDLELGTIVENGKNTRTGLKRMTGTLKYMAIEVLELGLSGARPDLQHTYRHDLESFFYVFLSICVSHGWDRGKAPKLDPFRSWYIGNDYRDNMRAKTGDMERGRFRKEILGQFSPTFRTATDLAMTLRDVLFLRGDELRTDTPSGDASILYDQMTAAFDRAIGECTE
jgi:hypothetical protein